jgi:hypothetical protein
MRCPPNNLFDALTGRGDASCESRQPSVTVISVFGGPSRAHVACNLPTELVDFFKKQKETGQFDGRRELQSTNAERQVTRAVTSSEQLLLANCQGDRDG